MARRSLGWALALLCSAFSCGDAAEGDGDGVRRPQQSAMQSDAEPRGDETLIIALRQLPRGLDPLSDLEPWGQRIADDLVFEGLLRRRTDAHPWAEPSLADRCETDDAEFVRRVWCHVPEGRVFHDGTPVAMEDVAYSIHYWLDPRRAWMRQRHGLGALKGVEIYDGPADGRDPGRWIRIHFSRREPLALEALTAIKIVPREAHRGRPGKFGAAPVGTGPMRVASLGQDRWVLERDEGWARENRPAPAVGRMVFRAVNDGAQALTLLRRAEVHAVDRMAPSHVPVELGKPGMAARFRAWLVTPARYDVLLYNLRKDVGLTRRVREAIETSLPRAALARDGYGAPSSGSSVPVDLEVPRELDLDALVDVRKDQAAKVGLPDMPELSTDVTAAARGAGMLDELGWVVTRGVRRRGEMNLRITLMWDGAGGRAKTVSETIRGAWKELDIQTPQAVASWAYLLSLMRKGMFEVALMRLTSHEDGDLFGLFHSKGAMNIAGVADAELDAAVIAYRRARTRADRQVAKAKVAERLDALRVVSMLQAPAEVFIASRRVVDVAFEDDLPRLDLLDFAPVGTAGVWDRR